MYNVNVQDKTNDVTNLNFYLKIIICIRYDLLNIGHFPLYVQCLYLDLFWMFSLLFRVMFVSSDPLDCKVLETLIDTLETSYYFGYLDDEQDFVHLKLLLSQT